MFLLDTNICIDFVDARSAFVQERVRANHSRGLGVSAITAAELLVGPRTSDDPNGDRQKVQTFLSLLTFHDFDARAADVYGEIVRATGVHRLSFDRLIAAQAVAIGLTLVTDDERHFAHVPGLKIENWTK